MGKRSYRIDADGSRVRVTARSSIHDTETIWSRVSGTIEVDPDAIAEGASAEIEVVMTEFDAGDWLKNRKLRKDLAVSEHPRASFRLDELVDVAASGDETSARATGTIAWRGEQASIAAEGSARVTSELIRATASFELDVTKLGVRPPKILMIKVEDVVSVSVELVARAS